MACCLTSSLEAEVILIVGIGDEDMGEDRAESYVWLDGCGVC